MKTHINAIAFGAAGTWTAPIDPHVAYEFRWVSGIYAQETSFVIYIGTEQRVSASGFDYAGGAAILSVAQSCSGTCLHQSYEKGACNVRGANMILAIEMTDVYSDGWTDKVIYNYGESVKNI